MMSEADTYASKVWQKKKKNTPGANFGNRRKHSPPHTVGRKLSNLSDLVSIGSCQSHARLPDSRVAADNGVPCFLVIHLEDSYLELLCP